MALLHIDCHMTTVIYHLVPTRRALYMPVHSLTGFLYCVECTFLSVLAVYSAF